MWTQSDKLRAEICILQVFAAWALQVIKINLNYMDSIIIRRENVAKSKINYELFLINYSLWATGLKHPFKYEMDKTNPGLIILIECNILIYMIVFEKVKGNISFISVISMML